MTEDREARDIRIAAMNLLARREHARAELLAKLSRRFSDATAVAAAVEQLAAEGLQSDERFCEALVAMRTRKGQGPVRIRLELQERGICANLIDSHLDESDSDWVELAREVYRKRFGAAVATDTKDPKDRARQMRFLQYRGFTGEQIRRVLER
ncbi:regulatory protein RecX [Exilibacterium tricleocarpae]|uniref:Regulatory protein RecX n=1 Tax=Exilibacterium tricleocarpae TaxID=2591008 RepID=A0A545U6Z8_9GAMM|nr:regulatory protein RecX [Exilibacterium tricleocarpae]TQV85245.1 regulatory protein RecX [Exilibacterium tricleocarpae]